MSVVRVLHVIDNMYLDRGGPVAVVSGLGGSQAGAGDQVAVVCRARVRSSELRSAAHALPDGIDLQETGESGIVDADSVLDRLRPDILHVHGVWESYLRKFALNARKRGIPWVLSTHGMMHSVPMSRGYLKKRAYLSLLGAAVRHAHRLFVTSRQEREFATRITGVTSEVVFNGVDLSPFAGQSPATPRDRSPLGSFGIPYLLFLGRIHPIKGIDGLVRSYAIARSRGLRANLVLAGPPDGHDGTVAALARELGVSDSVHFVGPLYGPAKLDALAGCALFVHRPRYEGFGMTVVEAMAAGRPVLTTAACGVARECPRGVLDSSEDSDEAFAAAMVRRCSADAAAETEALAARGRDWVRRELSWDAIARRVRELYR
jgi:glycosyltransferase involved in cell wall biosynthesis